MNEKERFVALAKTGKFTVSELCKDFGISRKTGHKYIKRYEAEGHSGLKERSRRPKSSPGVNEEGIEKLISKKRQARAANAGFEVEKQASNSIEVLS